MQILALSFSVFLVPLLLSMGDLQRVFPAVTCVVSGQALTRLHCAGSFVFCQVPEAGWADKF